MTSTLDRGPAARWLPFPAATTGVRLYCLPHAGGAASVFRPWIDRAAGIAVRPVQPAGRETRLSEPPHTTMPALVAELADALLADLAVDGGWAPYALYGHSLGSLVAFELVHELRRRAAPAPVHLFVSGAAAPQWVTPEPDPTELELSDPEIVELLRVLGGTPEIFLSDPRVLRMIMPPIRADLAVKKSYRYAPRPPLSLPVTALAGTADVRAPVASMAAWREQTVRRFTLHTLDGGHFAVLERAEQTLAHLTAALRP